MTDNQTFQSPKVRKWLSRLRDHGCAVDTLAELKTLRKRDGSVLFTLIEAGVRAPEGRSLPPYVFVRGDACLIVPLVIDQASGARAFCMIRQRRIAHGALALEFPAGMLDERIDSPREVAVAELYEETGLRVAAADLAPLSREPLFSSPGASDEAIHYFGCVIPVSGDVFARLEGRIGGSDAEDEHTEATLKTRDEAWRESSSLQARLGLCLFEQHFDPAKGALR
jgi:8-oxo-dGTP pyrophosphatase MutT (NUDIX family)